MSQAMIDRISERLKQLKLSPRAASLSVSTNPDLFRGILRKGSAANPTNETLALMARALGVRPEWLMTGEGDAGESLPAAVKANEVSVANVNVPSRTEMPDDMPVMGTAAGSIVHFNEAGDIIEGFVIEGGGPIQYVRRPPALAHVKDSYSFYVEGDSMSPRHNPGELRFANPRRPAAPGDTVVVQTRAWNDDPGQAYIKIYRRRTAERLILEQFNPACTIEIPLKYVVSVHLVMDMNELFGM